MKIELLSLGGDWVEADYKTKEVFLSTYENAIFVTQTNEYDYYANNAKSAILYRMPKAKTMTRLQAEAKYNIRIEG